MKIVIPLLVFSFLLEGFVSNYQVFTLVNPSMFSTIYVLVSLVIVAKYFEEVKKILVIAMVVGLVYDLIYTGVFPLHMCLFPFITFCSYKVHDLVSDTVVNSVLMALIFVMFYHVLLYIIFMLVDYIDYSHLLLFKIMGHSILMTGLYAIFNYYVLKYFFKKLDIRIIR